MLGLSLHDDPVTYAVQCLLFRSAPPTSLRRTELRFNDGIESVSPRSRGDARIGSDQVRPRDVQIQVWLTPRLVLGLDYLTSLIFSDRAQAGAFAGFGIDAVEGSAAITPTNQTVVCFHGSFHATATIQEADSAASASSERVNARYAEFLQSGKTGVRCG